VVERRCIYAVLVGGYEALLEQPVAAVSGIDLLCFTDDVTQTSETWQIRPYRPVLEADLPRSSRRPKILAHEYLQDYDVSLYIDNSVLLTSDPAQTFDRHVDNSGSDFHSWPRAARRASARGVPLGSDPEPLIDGLQARVAMLEAESGDRRAVIEELHDQLHYMGRLVDQKDAMFSAQQLELGELPALRSARCRLEAINAGLDNRVADLAVRLADLGVEVAALRASTSWRMTAPARRLSALGNRRRVTYRPSNSLRRGPR
jgi:hypothetical protein